MFGFIHGVRFGSVVYRGCVERIGEVVLIGPLSCVLSYRSFCVGAGLSELVKIMGLVVWSMVHVPI